MQAYVVDAFTDVAFRGNPAGVVLLDEPADASWMQDVAAELKHSETAFLLPRPDGDYDLRWFTPAVEVDLCGHATLAATHVLADGEVRQFIFHTRSGPLSGIANGDGTRTLKFPSQPCGPIAEPDGLREALGVAPTNIEGNGIDVLVEVIDARTVADLSPDIGALRDVECRGVIVTAVADEDADHDFVSRFFAPRVGVDEDPVTGSAHCTLGPYWSRRLGLAGLAVVQLSPRGGRIGLLVSGDHVELYGRAVTVLDGELRV